MDPEVSRQLEEQFRQTTEMLAQMNATMAGTVKSMQAASTQQTNAVKNLTNSTNQQNNAQNIAAQSTTKLAQVNKEYSEKTSQAMANLSRAFESGKVAVTSFANAVLSSERGFSKYGSGIKSAGDAAFDVGKNFGIVGTIFGGVFKGLGMLAERAAKQADDINNFADTWKKTGAIGGMTNLELANMARKIGYSSMDLEKLTKAMGTLGPSVVNLGGTAASGQKMFLNMANIGTETQKRFNRMGLQLEDVNEMQAEFVKLQRLSGKAYSDSAKDQAELKKRSLEYVENLVELAALTGESTDELRRRQEIAAQEYQELVTGAANKSKIAKLREQGTAEALAEAEKLEKSEKAREAMRNQSVQFGDSMGAQIRDYVRSGRIDQNNIAAYRLGGDALRKLKALTDAGASEDAIKAQMDEVRRVMSKNYKQNAESFSTALNNMSASQAEELGKTLLGDKQFMQAMGQEGTGKTPAQRRAEVEAGLETGGSEGYDQAADTRANLTIVEQKLKGKFDQLLQDFNPFLGNGGKLLDKLADAAKAAAVILGAIVAAKVVVSGARGIKNLFSGGSKTTAAAAGGGGLLKSLTGRGGAAAGAGAELADKLDGKDAQSVKKVAANPVATATGGFLEGLAKGFTALGRVAPQVIQGSVAVSAAITLVGAAIAAATYLMGSALPNLAKGLKTFDGINGKNLEAVGKGMAGLGVGILAMGGGQVLSAIGNLATIFSEETPVQKAAKQLQEFEKIEVNKEKVDNNAQAFAAFAKAFSIGGLQSGIGEVSSAIAGSVVSFFDKSPPFDKFVNFSNLVIDPAKTEINATAFKKFSEAMATYKGMGTINALGAISSALADATFKFFKAKPPVEQFEAFSKLKIDPKQTKENAIAFRDFANAMAEYKGGPGVMDVISSKLGSLATSVLGDDGPVAAFKKFSEMDFGPNMEKNVEGFRKYAETVNKAPSGSGGVGDGTEEPGLFSSFSQGYSATGAPSPGDERGTTSPTAEFDLSKAKGPWRKDPAFLAEVDRVAKKYGFSSSALIGLMMSESGINPQAKNPNGGATGLIQFMPSTARALGTSTSDLYRMDRAQQMKYVDEFFGQWAKPGGLSGASPGRLYAYVFLPGRAKREILTTSDEAYYKANKGLDMDKDGRISIADLDRRVAMKAMQAKKGGFFTGPTAGYPMELHGTEMVTPVNVDSILMKLAKTPANETKDTKKKSVDMSAYQDNLLLTEAIARKLDDVIDMLDDQNSTSKKLLKHSRA